MQEDHWKEQARGGGSVADSLGRLAIIDGSNQGNTCLVNLYLLNVKIVIKGLKVPEVLRLTVGMHGPIYSEEEQ
jgi:hypothetical protein